MGRKRNSIDQTVGNRYGTTLRLSLYYGPHFLHNWDSQRTKTNKNRFIVHTVIEHQKKKKNMKIPFRWTSVYTSKQINYDLLY